MGYLNQFPGSIVKMNDFSYAKIIGLSASLILMDDTIVALGLIAASSVEADR